MDGHCLSKEVLKTGPIITARIRRMGKVMFSVCLSVHIWGWGGTYSGLGGGGGGTYLARWWGGGTHLG